MSQEFSIDLTSRLTTEEIVVLRNKFDLRPNEVEQIQVLIENVDKILNIQDHDSAKPINIDTSNKEWVKMSSLDIFKFRLNNRNCMRSIALFTFGNPSAPSINLLQYAEVSTYQNVFTIADLFYSRDKTNDLTKQISQRRGGGVINFVTNLDDWFDYNWFSPAGKEEFSLKLMVTSYYSELGQYLIGADYYIDDNKMSTNLMINIFILFICFSDQIATLSMYTPTGNEARYYYKTDSEDMRIILKNFNTNKWKILDNLHQLIHAEYTDFSDSSKYPDKTFILQELVQVLLQKGYQTAALIVTYFLHAYSQVYFNKQFTNLSDSLNNDFFQDYVVKFTLLTTMMVTFQKSPPCSQDPTASNKCQLLPSKKNVIVAKRKATAQKNKETAEEALRKQKENEQNKKEMDIKNRQERARKRDTIATARAATRADAKEAEKTEGSSELGAKRGTTAKEIAKEKNRHDPIVGGSTKIVVYLVKIEKIRELNKKLRKNKTKNKSKIEKNNKLIDELNVKIKKQKQKEKLKKQKEKKLEKEKLKKQKEKEKLKKQKEKLKKQKEKEKKKGKSKKKQKK